MKTILLLITILFLQSCGESKLEQSLHLAGDNRVELQRVLDHYNNAGDQLKYDAAVFLIGNMQNKRSVTFSNKQNFDSLVFALGRLNDPISWDARLSILHNSLDSMINQYPFSLSTKLDLTVIEANVLIGNIDHSFMIWEQTPWKSQYSFDEFYEYVLPYKIDNEPTEDWRSIALNKDIMSRNQYDSLTQFEIATKLLNNSNIGYNIGMGQFPYPTSFSANDIIRKGACAQMANQALFYHRAYGMPSALDFTPAWANRSSSHIWNALIKPSNKTTSIGFHPEGLNYFNYKLSKIYRKTYKIQNAIKYSKHEVVPRLFGRNNNIDVTAQYDMPVYDIPLELKNNSSKVENVYLSTFNNQTWVPVAHTKKDGRNAIFKDMATGKLPADCDAMIRYINQGNGIVYLPIYSLINGIAVASTPVILDTTGNIRELTPNSEITQNARITRKYPLAPQFNQDKEKLVGGRIEVSNFANFTDAETIFVVRDIQEYPMMLHPTAIKNAKYARFVHDDGKGALIAEIQLYGKNGERIEYKQTNNKAIDNNLLTFYEDWQNTKITISIELKHPSKVAGIRYSARTDDNGIVVGEDYELYYWNNKWVSLGAITATEPYLDYQNIPTECLFLLRNHTKGVEKRIFTLENGKQIWW